MTGTSKMYCDGKVLNLLEISQSKHQEFELKTKQAIARSLGKKTIKVVRK